MKILMVSNYFSNHGGGIEIVAGNLAATLTKMGCNVTWSAFSSGLPTASPARILPLQGSNMMEKRTGIPYPILSSSSIRRLREEVAASDIVHLHDCIYESSRVAARHARKLGKPVIITQHIGALPFKGLHHKLLYRMAENFFTQPMLRRASKVVFISENVRTYYRACFIREKQAETIFNGLDSSLFRFGADRTADRTALRLPADARISLFVGRFVEKKGLERIQALARQDPQVQWILIGRGPIDPSAWKLPNVRVVGQVPQPEIARWLNAADLFTLLSTGEGFPLVVQEALACGCPAFVSDEIATACPLIRDHVFRAAPDFRDIHQVYTQALATLQEKTEERGERAAFFNNKWSWPSCGARYFDLYQELLSAPSR
ncbi:MAG: glycosyltransferase family 4 protein [Opitutaceae bacterium]